MMLYNCTLDEMKDRRRFLTALLIMCVLLRAACVLLMMNGDGIFVSQKKTKF